MSSLERNLSKLPEICYSVSDSGELIQLHRNQSGYYPSALSSLDETKNRILANQLNADLCVTKAQEQAMLAGSMFGFDVPGADPDRYTDSGMPRNAPETPVLEDDERGYILNDGEFYFYIQTYEDGYDYTIYRRDFSELDGGQYDDSSITMDEAVEIILKDFDMQDLPRDTYDIDQLQSCVDGVELARFSAAREKFNISPLDERIYDARERSVQPQGREGLEREDARS